MMQQRGELCIQQPDPPKHGKILQTFALSLRAGI
jgi:hypothetical protein